MRYQDWQPDHFYYKYDYDADNRITDAWSGTQVISDGYTNTSRLLPDNQKMDAHYQYYLHGPLARVELGDQLTKVQGTDYAYTLQGWLKGVNGSSLAGDINGDGSAVGNIGKDAYAYSLGYYNGDYTPIGGVTHAVALSLNYLAAPGDNTGQNLYNGNISNSTQSISGSTFGYTYHYDQLNRLKTVLRNNGAIIPNWNSNSFHVGDQYSESFSYDANGNIQTATRNANSSLMMDDLTYHYTVDANGYKVNNRLNYVTDASDDGVSTTDIKTQSVGNYTYDAIGNLTGDAQAGITNIGWTVYGKIQNIAGTNNITYAYNAADQRVSKATGSLNTYYVRDAQGNTLALYDAPASGSSSPTWREQDLYGGSRLGQWHPNLSMGTGATTTATDVQWQIWGYKEYELNNHLGNVMATITDRRLQIGNGGHEADIGNFQQYYAFGMVQPGSGSNSSLVYNSSTQLYEWQTVGVGYRYGFNGKENDNDVKKDANGNEIVGGQQDYGMRIYDPRLGRFLSVDPIGQHFPWNTPYSFAENKVMEGIDFDGLEVMIVTQKSDPTIYNVGIQNTSKDEINVYAHGTQHGLGNNDGLWFHTENEFDKYMTKVSEQWRNKQSDGGTVLVLHSCRTGKPILDKSGNVVGPPIAQKISKQFNVTVIAPDERDNFSKDGEVGPLVDEDPNQDNNGNHPDHKHHEASDIKGNWNVFKDGVLIESYRGGWTPKAKATWWDKLIYGRDIKKVQQATIKNPEGSSPTPDANQNSSNSSSNNKEDGKKD